MQAVRSLPCLRHRRYGLSCVLHTSAPLCTITIAHHSWASQALRRGVPLGAEVWCGTWVAGGSRNGGCILIVHAHLDSLILMKKPRSLYTHDALWRVRNADGEGTSNIRVRKACRMWVSGGHVKCWCQYMSSISVKKTSRMEVSQSNVSNPCHNVMSRSESHFRWHFRMTCPPGAQEQCSQQMPQSNKQLHSRTWSLHLPCTYYVHKVIVPLTWIF